MDHGAFHRNSRNAFVHYTELAKWGNLKILKVPSEYVMLYFAFSNWVNVLFLKQKADVVDMSSAFWTY